MVKNVSVAEYFCLHRKFLIFNLITRNLKIRYRKSFLGMIWTVLIPAGTACIYFFVFNFIFKVKIPNYPFFILCGLIPWTFFITTITASIESLVGNVQLLNKVPLPIPSLPLSETLTQFLNLLLSIPVLIAAMLILKVPLTVTAIQYPLLIALLFLVTHALGLTFALLYVYFRDLKHLVALVLQFWFYLTPVMYAESMIPAQFRPILQANPLAGIFLGFHTSLVDGEWIPLERWAIILAWTLSLVLISKFLLSRMSNSITETL